MGILAAVALLLVAGRSADTQGTAAALGQWYKADLHVHSVFSADAYPDLGILTTAAKAQGFNAIFLTDHNLASNFPISGLTANHMTLDDTLDSSTGYFRRWTKATDGSLTASTNAVVTQPKNTGVRALSLSSTAASGSAGETFAWTKRGPNFRSETGTTTITFSVYPTRIDSGSSLYVSASIGGDVTINDPSNNPVGYTAAGAVQPGKSTIMIWYIGSPPPASLFPGAHVTETSLGTYTLNAWNTYTINTTAAVQALPAVDQPLDYDALSDLKITASANGGTASGVFDTYAIDAPTASGLGATLAADEFVYRNSLIDSHVYDTSTFKLFPAVELGTLEHANRLAFDITNASQFVSYTNGIDGIGPAQQAGYPAQLNHPGVPGGVSDSQATSTNAEGADVMEVRQQNMIDDWDTILRQNVTLPPIGTWGGDNHIGSWSGSSQATYLYAPSLDFNALLQALYEGRAYLGTSTMSSGLVFNLDGTSPEPYPTRYPDYVAATQPSVNVSLAIGGGLSGSSDTVRWLSNDGSLTTTTVIATDTATGSSYAATKSIPFASPGTYVRAEVRNSSGGLKAMSEAITFKPVIGLPGGMSYHVQRVTNPGGTSYEKLDTKGITASSWNGGSNQLSMTLTDVVGALVELRVGTGSLTPSSMTVDGSTIGAAPDLATFQAATGSSWFYDSTAHLLYLKAKHATSTAAVVVSFGAGVNHPPTAGPVTLSATTATAASWTPVVSDPDGDALTCSIVSPATSGTATVSSNCSSGSYTSNAGFTGSDSFTYKATDPSLATSSPATVTVTVSPPGAISLVQQVPQGGTGTSLVAPLQSASTAGDTLVAEIALAAGSSASVLSVTDSGGGAWTRGPIGFLSGANSRIEIWYRLGGPSATSVTATLSASKSAAMNVSEWSGVASASVPDGSASGSGTSATSISTPSLTTTNPIDLVIGAVNYPATATSTLNAGAFTGLLDFNASSSVHGRAAYRVTSAAGSSQASWTLTALSGGNGEAILALKGAGGGGGGGGAPPAPALTLTESDATDFVNGSQVFYRPGTSGAFTVAATSAGATNVQFPIVFGGDGANDSLPPFAQTYTWSGTPGTFGSFAVTASNGSGSSPSSPFTVTPDATAPSTTAACNGSACAASYSSAVSVSLTASDDAVGSGVASTYYTTDGSDPASSGSHILYTAPFQVGATTTVRFASSDNVGNQEPAQTLPITISGGGGATATFTPSDDAYVDSSQPALNTGTSTVIRVDGSPVLRTYLKFTVTGLSGTVASATLRVWANSTQSVGYDVYSVSDTTWTQGALTSNNAPALSASKTGSSGPVIGGTWTTVNVTALVSGNGTISIALVTTSSTNLSMSSMEGANPPQLVVTTT